MKKIAGVLVTLLTTGVSIWIFWGPVLSFLTSLIPESAEYAWVGKLIIVGLVGYFGGIAIPLAIFALGIYLTGQL